MKKIFLSLLCLFMATGCGKDKTPEQNNNQTNTGGDNGETVQKPENDNNEMHFDNSLEKYVIEYDGIIFAFDVEPSDGYEKMIQAISKKYWNNLDFIIEFMFSDLQQMYGEIDTLLVKEKLGKPIIDYYNGQVLYCEQLFDDIHIFSFEFLDGDFKELQYFSIDG